MARAVLSLAALLPARALGFKSTAEGDEVFLLSRHAKVQRGEDVQLPNFVESEDLAAAKERLYRERLSHKGDASAFDPSVDFEEHFDGQLYWDHLQSLSHFSRKRRGSHDEVFEAGEMLLRELIIGEMIGNFPNRPSEDHWKDLLVKATSTPEDPCDAEVLTTYGWNAGFGSGTNVMMAEVALATYFGRTIARCHAPGVEPYSFYNLWQHPLRFCNRSELCSDTRQYAFEEGSKRTPWGFAAIFWGGCLNSMECELNPKQKSPWLTPAQRHPGVSGEWRQWSKRFRHFIYDSIFRINEDAEEQRDGWIMDNRPPAGEPYVGVHLRGGDKWTEAPNVSIPLFVGQVLLAMNRTKSSLVFLASDDWELSMAFKLTLLAVAPKATVLHKTVFEYRDKIGRRGGHNLNSPERSCLLGELEILRNATAFVGTASSNIGRLVYFLREPEEGEDTLSISVDEGNDFFSRFC